MICGGGSFTPPKFRMPASDLYAYDIAVGPDKAIWFTEVSFSGLSHNKIGRMSPTGTITEFPLPPKSAPNRIVAGPDGALWFTELGVSVIGRMTISGTVTEFPLPIQQAFVKGITVGPDGNLGFTVPTPDVGARSTIGRITRTGTVTQFPVPAGILPHAITTGADGALWFTGAAQSKGAPPQIVRMTPAGQFSTFPLSTPNAILNDIIAGRDGNMWFGMSGKLGRITTAGKIIEYPLPTSCNSAAGIAVAPDKSLWFTEASSFGPSGPHGSDPKIGHLV